MTAQLLYKLFKIGHCLLAVIYIHAHGGYTRPYASTQEADHYHHLTFPKDEQSLQIIWHIAQRINGACL